MCLITWYSSDIPLPPNISLAFLAISNAFMAEFFFIIEIISGVALKNFIKYIQIFILLFYIDFLIQNVKPYLSSSFSLPTLRQAWRPNEMSHIISTSFFCINWLAASGLLNCFLCRQYALDMCKQASAAPKAPQAIPYLALFRQTNGPCTSISSRVRAPRYTENFRKLTLRPFTFGSIFSSGTSKSSMRIIPVMEHLRENLPLIIGVISRLSFSFLSTMNPRISLSSKHFAQIIIILAIGAFVILDWKERWLRRGWRFFFFFLELFWRIYIYK